MNIFSIKAISYKHTVASKQQNMQNRTILLLSNITSIKHACKAHYSYVSWWDTCNLITPSKTSKKAGASYVYSVVCLCCKSAQVQLRNAKKRILTIINILTFLHFQQAMFVNDWKNTLLCLGQGVLVTSFISHRKKTRRPIEVIYN